VLCALFDEKQVWVSERCGEAVPLGEFPWRWTLCGWSLAFKSPQVLVIPDTHKDARWAGWGGSTPVDAHNTSQSVSGAHPSTRTRWSQPLTMRACGAPCSAAAHEVEAFSLLRLCSSPRTAPLQSARRFANNKKVTEAPFVRFYCGVPLVAQNGHRLGTL